METIEKTDIVKMKNDIKEMVKTQKWLKNQRKTVNKDCTRKKGDPDDIAPWMATMRHTENREKLRVMYAAYGKARGKKFSQTENLYPEEEHPLQKYNFQIHKILLTYKIKVKVESVEIGKVKNDEV